MDNNIDMVNNVTFNAVLPGLDPNKVPEPAKTAGEDTSDATVKTEYASVINKALETEEIDLKAVQEAQNAIQEGTLDTPENITAAAENILEQGI